MNAAPLPPMTLPPEQSYDAAWHWLERLPRGARVAICHSGEVNGVASAALVARFLKSSGRSLCAMLTPEKGSDMDDPALLARLRRSNPDALIVLDQPSQKREVRPDVPTLVVADDEPADANFGANAYAGRGEANPSLPTSLVTYRILTRFADLSDYAWYASLGIIADRGSDAAFTEHTASKKRWGQKHLVETATLINAAKRASAHDTTTGLAALLNAETPADLADGMIAEYDVLDEYRMELQHERTRCAKISPQFSGDWAVVRFSSSCQIESTLSAAWVGRLPKNFVLAANEGYLPDSVYFSVRTRREDDDLAEQLRHFRNMRIREAAGPQASEWIRGVTTKADFHRLLSDLGLASLSAANS